MGFNETKTNSPEEEITKETINKTSQNLKDLLAELNSKKWTDVNEAQTEKITEINNNLSKNFKDHLNQPREEWKTETLNQLFLKWTNSIIQKNPSMKDDLQTIQTFLSWKKENYTFNIKESTEWRLIKEKKLLLEIQNYSNELSQYIQWMKEWTDKDQLNKINKVLQTWEGIGELEEDVCNSLPEEAQKDFKAKNYKNGKPDNILWQNMFMYLKRFVNQIQAHYESPDYSTIINQGNQSLQQEIDNFNNIKNLAQEDITSFDEKPEEWTENIPEITNKEDIEWSTLFPDEIRNLIKDDLNSFNTINKEWNVSYFQISKDLIQWYINDQEYQQDAKKTNTKIEETIKKLRQLGTSREDIQKNAEYTNNITSLTKKLKKQIESGIIKKMKNNIAEKYKDNRTDYKKITDIENNQNITSEAKESQLNNLFKDSNHVEAMRRWYKDLENSWIKIVGPADEPKVKLKGQLKKYFKDDDEA